MPRTIAIGDIHGCLKPLQTLLEAIDPQPGDLIITVGDYVDRGVNSKGVIDCLIQLQISGMLYPLLGNHEEMMIDVIERRIEPFGWINHGGVDTLDSYGFVGDLSVIPDSHREFLKGLKSYYENETHFVVHANYDPAVPLEEQSDTLLRWIKLTDMVPDPHVSGKRAVVGHTHNRKGEIVALPHLVCIDTYCYGGQWLTALELESGQVWQASLDGTLRHPSPMLNV